MSRDYISVLPEYANASNMRERRSQAEEERVIRYSDGEGHTVTLSETNSLVEDRYSMNLHAARYIVEGHTERTEAREAMIHHHPQGHAWKHLQFKLRAGENRVIRIDLEPLDLADYERCIRGFLFTAKLVIERERAEQGIGEDLVGYFFNARIGELETERRYLLGKIRAAFDSGRLLDGSDNPVIGGGLETLRREVHLLPFLDWE